MGMITDVINWMVRRRLALPVGLDRTEIVEASVKEEYARLNGATNALLEELTTPANGGHRHGPVHK